MPLGFTEAMTRGKWNLEGYRCIYGGVTDRAATVQANLVDGTHVTMTPQGASRGFDRVWYMTHVKTFVNSLDAFDSDGRLIAHVIPGAKAQTF